MVLLAQYGKKIIATLLLGLFAFIYAEKIMHEHSFKADSKIYTAGQSVNDNTGCTICEFQLAPDTDVQVEIFSGLFCHSSSIDLNFQQPLFFNHSPSQLSERGPPALM